MHSFEQRRKEAQHMRVKYPDRIPVFCKRSNTQYTTDVPDLDKHKFMVPKNFTIGQFMFVLRKWIYMRPDQAIFIFIHNTIPPATLTFADVYEQYCHADGFVYLTYSGENTFGTH